MSESSDGLSNWTPDSKALLLNSDRNGTYGIYKQPLDSNTPEGPLVAPSDGTRNSRFTPDGKWVLYFGLGKDELSPASQPELVMRAPSSGGRSVQLFLAQTRSVMSCGMTPVSGCAIAEPTEDRSELIISRVDPLKGRGPELARFALDPNENNWFFALSPDGARIAVTPSPAAPIYILPVRGHDVRQIRVKGWDNHQDVSWVADGNGLFVAAGVRGGSAVLYVDLQGNAHAVWENTGASGETLAFSSPDGRHIVLQSWTTSGNMWMMENF